MHSAAHENCAQISATVLLILCSVLLSILFVFSVQERSNIQFAEVLTAEYARMIDSKDETHSYMVTKTVGWKNSSPPIIFLFLMMTRLKVSRL